MMANFRIPGPTCGSASPPLDEGSMVRRWTPAPGPLDMATPERQAHLYSRVGGFSASALRMSAEAVALLKAIETLRLVPYDDQTGKDIKAWVEGATIGYGHLIAKQAWDTYKNGLTAQQADTLFLEDAEPFERLVGETITAGLQQYEFDALVILAFNIGPGAFRQSSVAKLVNDPAAVTSFASLEDAWKAWNTSRGKVMAGLTQRRAAEWRIYTVALDARW